MFSLEYSTEYKEEMKTLKFKKMPRLGSRVNDEEGTTWDIWGTAGKDGKLMVWAMATYAQSFSILKKYIPYYVEIV